MKLNDFNKQEKSITEQINIWIEKIKELQSERQKKDFNKLFHLTLINKFNPENFKSETELNSAFLDFFTDFCGEIIRIAKIPSGRVVDSFSSLSQVLFY